MDINKLLHGIDCSCGKTHTCDIQYVYVERNASDRLSKICAKYNSILIVADENTFSAAGEQTVGALSGKRLKKVIFEGKKILVPDENAVKAVTICLDGIDLILGIGSGVIQDICKYVSSYNGLPYMIVATAPSMDGYASSGAAMITDGMKVTYPAQLPRAIIADTEVLANAPIDMIKAGYGDIIGKLSSLNDWRLSSFINGEYLCEQIYELACEQIDRTIGLAEGILKRDRESIKALTEALIIIGILISFAGSTRPASGSEHHLSHFFEITGIVTGTKYFSHGIDVAYSTVITAELREQILTYKFPKSIYRPRRQCYEKTMHSIYGKVADNCIALQDKVGNYANDRTAVYHQKEKEIRAVLSNMPSSAEIKRLLSLVNLDIKDFYSLYGERKIRNAIFYAKDLKDRYTVLWLYYDLFGDNENKM